MLFIKQAAIRANKTISCVFVWFGKKICKNTESALFYTVQWHH